MRALAAGLLLACIVLRPVTAEGATDRYFPDKHITSPGGALRLDAVSPDNAGDRRRPFARNFTYTLTDTASGAVIWQRRQPKDEGSPMRVFLSDLGHVVVHNSHETLLVLDAFTGRKSIELRLFETFGESECRAYVVQTTAGPMWWGTSHAYFIVHDDNEHFVLRTWWDRRVIIRLPEARLIDSPSHRLAEAFAAAECEWTLQEIERAAELAATGGLPDASWEQRSRVHTAIHLAGRLGLSDSEPYLRTLERDNRAGSSTVVPVEEPPETDGHVDPWSFVTVELRQRAQLALRRVGLTPQELGCVWFSTRGGEGLYVPRKHDSPRAERVGQVKQGMTVQQILDTVGCPDYVVTHRNLLEYDVDSSDPFTLVIELDRGSTQAIRVEHVRPPRWKDGFQRDGLLNW